MNSRGNLKPTAKIKKNQQTFRTTKLKLRWILTLKLPRIRC